MGLAVRIIVAVLLMMPVALVSAHEVIVEQVVEIFVEPSGSQLLVRVHVPAAVVGDANLPRLANGMLDVAAIDERALRIVAADLAHNLDVQQGDVVVPAPAAAARVGADSVSIDVQLIYASGAGTAGLSARVNAFRADGGPVRTNIRYRLPSGHDHTISVTGPSVRVAFDPGAIEIFQQFVAQGLRALIGGGDHLWFLVCVLLPVRRARSVAVLFAAAALGQALAIALSLLRPAMSVESLAVFAMIAASAVVIAALQNIVRAHLRWVGLLAFAFGVLNGFAFGQAFVPSSQFAWSHMAVAVLSFTAVILLGELWFGALAWATRTWLDERGVPERVVAFVASLIIAHGAVHSVVDRGHVVAQAGSFGAGRALMWLTLGWACVMMLVAVADAVSARARDSGHPPRAAKAPSPS